METGRPGQIRWYAHGSDLDRLQVGRIAHSVPGKCFETAINEPRNYEMVARRRVSLRNVPCPTGRYQGRAPQDLPRRDRQICTQKSETPSGREVTMKQKNSEDGSPKKVDKARVRAVQVHRTTKDGFWRYMKTRQAALVCVQGPLLHVS